MDAICGMDSDRVGFDIGYRVDDCDNRGIVYAKL
jgi:hypothetical protein